MMEKISLIDMRLNLNVEKAAAMMQICIAIQTNKQNSVALSP
jgi:hypothetical protein